MYCWLWCSCCPALAVAELLRPTRYWADVAGVPDLEAIIPNRFGDWTESPYGASSVVNPQQEDAVRTLYTKTLSRVYIHRPSGRAIMLAIAYGKDQSTATQVHPPEACYPSQGFRVTERAEVDLTTTHGPLKAVRLKAALGLRVEPVTYFVLVGDTVARGSLERNLVRLRFAARGYLADGLLFRVSEVTTRADAHAFQDRFINDLLTSISPPARQRLIGKLAG